MSNPQGPDNSDEPTEQVAAAADAEPATEVFAPAEPHGDELTVDPNERRFTAPSGFDAGSTQIINRSTDPATEPPTICAAVSARLIATAHNSARSPRPAPTTKPRRKPSACAKPPSRPSP